MAEATVKDFVGFYYLRCYRKALGEVKAAGRERGPAGDFPEKKAA